jgi:hypothetical protein
MSVVKFIGAWFCLTAAVALLVLGHAPFGLPGVLSIMSVAFSQAPTRFNT